MPGPWERYREQAQQQGTPWRRYQAQSAETPPGEPGATIGADVGRAAPNAAQIAEARRSAIERERRNMIGGPMVRLTAPLANMITDPDRRAGVARATRGFMRDVAEIPSLDLGRVARETADAAQQGVRDLPRTLGGIATHLPQIARSMTYGPWQDEERAQRELDIARTMGNQPQVEAAADRANANTANAGLNVVAPAAVVGAPSVLRAGATAAALDAPFALSRNSDQSLQERLPDALTEIGAVGATGSAIQGVANAAPRVLGRPSQTSVRAGEFEAAGVRPMLAATRGKGAAPMTMAIAENPIGGNVRRNLENSASDVARRSREVSSGYAQHGQPENVGEGVQAAVNRFSRDADAPAPDGGGRRNPAATSVREWSFRAKANALYDDVFRVIDQDEAAHIAGQTGATATADASRAALREIQGRVQAPNLAELVNDPQIGRIAQALEADQGALRFNDLRALRTWVREQRSRPALTQTIDQASLARLESALTEDIYTSAMVIGGEHAAQQLRRVDQFYRAGNQRIQNVLQPFADRSGRGSYDRIVALAREGGRQNSRALQSLRNSLKPDEWREVAATIIDDMGRPTSGNAQALEAGAFSLEKFVTDYARLSQDGRRILFGGAGRESLMAELDTLARVAGYLKQVRGFTNFSRSGSSLQNMSTLTAGLGGMASAVLGNPTPLVGLIGLGLGARMTGEMLTNPAFVRWLTSAGKPGRGVGGLRAQSVVLARLASRDPALLPLSAELSQRVPVANDNQGSTPPRRVAAAR